MNDELTYAPWVNTPGFVYEADKAAELEEAEEPDQELTRANTCARTPTPSEANASQADLGQANAEATRVMRRREFRALGALHQLQQGTSDRSPRRKSGVPFVLGALSVALLVIGLVWFGASWITYLVGF